MTQTFEIRRKTRGYLFIALALMLLLAAISSVPLRQSDLSLLALPRLLKCGPVGFDGMDGSVLWQIRLPRLVLGLLVGAALGVGGALMQAVFANPLAEPSVIGVTSGA